MRTVLNRLALAALLAATCGTASAELTPAQQADVDRLTDAVVLMFPIGRVFEQQAAADPTWPMKEKVDNVTPQQLACTRAELSNEGYRRVRRAEIEKYAQEHPSRLRDDVELLESGAARVFGKLVQAGIDKASSDDPTPIDPNEVFKGVSNEEILSMVTLANDPKYTELREVIGIGDALRANQSGSEAESKGEALGASITARLMIQAMGKCDVPPSAYF